MCHLFLHICLFHGNSKGCRYFLTLIFLGRNQGIALKTVFKFDCEPELINWADAIFTAGGDGMFLMAASKVRDQSIPVIGINTDPIR